MKTHIFSNESVLMIASVRINICLSGFLFPAFCPIFTLLHCFFIVFVKLRREEFFNSFGSNILFINLSQDMTISSPDIMNCTQDTEPPYAERHVRWCERTAVQIMDSLLLDFIDRGGLSFRVGALDSVKINSDIALGSLNCFRNMSDTFLIGVECDNAAVDLARENFTMRGRIINSTSRYGDVRGQRVFQKNNTLILGRRNQRFQYRLRGFGFFGSHCRWHRIQE